MSPARSGWRVAICFAPLFAACGPATIEARTAAHDPPAAVVAPLTPDQSAWVDSVLRALTLREKAAQMVWPTVLGDYSPSRSATWRRVVEEIRTHKVGGYTMSVGSPVEIGTKTNAMQRLADIPLIFGADFEFGAGFRARGGYFVPNAIDLGGATLFPPQMALGAARDTTLAYEQGRITAIEGRALGVHIAYAPVLDVNVNPANPVINTRSYGEDPHLDARLGSAFIRGLQEHGMIATAKHFPGHGDTDVNSHLALPVVTASRARLDSVELVPFRAAVAAGAGAFMSFHGAMPALDSSLAPGTLSSLVLTGLLRGEMGFGGLTISDAMDMRGVLDRFGAAEATKRAVAAGADVLIQPLSVRETIDAVVAGVAERRYDEARLDQSVRRILEMKARLGLHRRRLIDIDTLRAVIGDSVNVDVAREVARRSITLVKDSLSQIPLRGSDRAPILSITLGRRSDLPAGAFFDGVLRLAGARVQSVFIPGDDIAGGLDRALSLTDSAGEVVVSSYVAQRWDATTVAAPAAFANFVNTLVRRGKRPIVIAFGNPYLLQQIPAVPAYLIAWGGVPVSQEAAALALIGQAPITGRLPISIPPHFRYGHGLSR